MLSIYLFLLILKQQQIPHKCRLVEGCLYPILFCQYLDDIQSIYAITIFQRYNLKTTKGARVCYGKGLSLCLLNMQKIPKMG